VHKYLLECGEVLTTFKHRLELEATGSAAKLIFYTAQPFFNHRIHEIILGAILILNPIKLKHYRTTSKNIELEEE
jgi:hypothetical protein